MDILISIIIPSYNSKGTIRHVLDSLQEQCREHSLEIIIVDSSDDNETRHFISEYDLLNLSHIVLSEKTYPAKARNIGAKKATGNFLVFIDADACPAHDWVENIIKAISKGYKVGGRGDISSIFSAK